MGRRSHLKLAALRAILVAAGLSFAAWLGPLTAPAQDPQADLAAAEAEVSQAQADIESATADLKDALAKRRPFDERANAAIAEAEEAEAGVEDLSAQIAAEREDAATEVEEAEAAYQQEKDDYDKSVALGIGAGLALIVLALLPLGWASFRSSGVVQRLAAETDGRAYGIIGAVALVGAIVGGILAGSATGVLAGFGMFLLVLGLGFAAALFWARRQTLVEPEGEPAGSSEAARRISAAVLGAVGLLAIAAPLLAGGPDEPALSEETLALAALAGEDVTESPTAELEEAIAALAPLERKAERLDDRRNQADEGVQDADRAIEEAGDRLASARSDVKLISNKIQKAEARAQRQAQKEAEEQEAQEEQVSGGGGGGGNCEPGYDPCVPSYPPDLDCGDLNGPYTVSGSDPHGLDADNDGVGCE